MATTLHYILIGSGDTSPTAAQIVAGVSYTGATVHAAGDVTYTSAGTYDFDADPATGLTPGTTYTLWAVAYDGSNYGTPVSGSVTTNATSNAALGVGYSIHAGAAATLSTGYAVSGTGAADLGVGYAIRDAGSSTLGAGYAIRAAGNAALDAGYAVRAAGFASLAAGYSIRAGSSATLDVGYEVEAGAGVGAATLGVGYAVAASGSATLAAGYAVRAADHTALGAGYAIRDGGLSDLPVGYAIRDGGQSVLAAGYAVSGSGFATLNLGYRVDSAGGSADPADVWNYVLSNGKTAEETAVETHAMLTALTALLATCPANLGLVLKLLRNKQITDPGTGLMTVYDDDGTTVLLQGNLYEDAAGATAYRGQGAERRERLS